MCYYRITLFLGLYNFHSLLISASGNILTIIIFVLTTSDYNRTPSDGLSLPLETSTSINIYYERAFCLPVTN